MICTSNITKHDHLEKQKFIKSGLVTNYIAISNLLMPPLMRVSQQLHHTTESHYYYLINQS